MRQQSCSSDRVARGLWIAVFGPDGVGKSALIECLEANPGDAFRGCTRFHFRPHFGCGDRGRDPVTQPHAQSPRGVVLSICKLLYWLLDCWLGYLFFVSPNLRRSRLVIFDRYLPDILIDPVRYRLPASGMAFAGYIAGLALQPDLCILLDAPAETVQQRKREVSPAESQRQRFEYLNLFRTLAYSLVVNADRPVADVADNVSAAMHHFMMDSHRQQRAALVADAQLD